MPNNKRPYNNGEDSIKSDNQKQSLLLPPSLDELIPLTHSVRVVNAMIDRLDVDAILRTYRGGGNSCFHPRQMSCFHPRQMLKILVYAYLNNIAPHCAATL